MDTMTVEQAAEAIGSTPETEVPETEVPEFADENGTPIEGDEEEIEPNEPDDDEDEEEPEDKPEPVPAPKSWSKEDVKVFEALTPEAQAIITRRESERDAYVRDAGRKASEARHTVTNEAREVLAQQAEQHAQMLQAYGQLIIPAEPDVRLLYSGDPNDTIIYQRQEAAHRAGVSQQQQLHQAIAQSQQQANAAREAARTAETQVDAQRLAEQLPEWFENPNLQQQLQSIGAELGYPNELMAQASSVDILALHKAAEWKAKAEKYDQLNKGKMEAVRAAKGLPKMGQPGTVQSRGQQTRSGSSKTADLIAQFQRDRSPEAAAALLSSRNRK